MGTWQIRSNCNERKRRVPMLYNNICIRLPMSPRPATVSLTPYEAAEPFLELVELALELVEVPLPLTALVGLDVVVQVYLPWMTPPFWESKVLQSIWAVLSTLKPPLTLVRAGRDGLETLV